MKNRSMRLVSCVILSLVVHTALAATFFYAVKPKPVTLEISNPIRVSLVDDYSSATGTEDDDSLSSGLTGDSAQEFSNETDLTENDQFDPNILEMQMVAAIELQDEIATVEPQSETIEDLDNLRTQDSHEEFMFDAALETNFETKDELTKENLDSIVSKLEETSASATIPVTEHPVPARVENPSNESQNEIPKSSNDTKPPESIKSIVNVQSEDTFSHSELDIAVRDAVNEKPMPGLDPIEPESLSQTFSNHRAAAADPVKIDNFDNANYNPVSPDFDSEFVRWAQLDFESVSNTEPDKIPETKNDAVDQTLNPEVFQRIGNFEESLSAEFNNSIPDEVTQKENSQHPSQFATNSDSSERSPIVSVPSENIYSHSEPDIAVRDAVNEKPLPGTDPIEPESLSQTFSNHQAVASDFVKNDNFDNTNYDPVSPDFDSEFVRWAQLDFESVSHTEPNKIPETKNDAVDQTLNPEVLQSTRKFEENLSAEFNNLIPDEVTQEENSHHPSQFAAISDSSGRSPIVSVQSDDIYAHSEQDIAVRDAIHGKPLSGLDPVEPESLSQTFSNHQAAAADSVNFDNFDSANYDPVSPDFDSEFVRWAQLDFESVSHTEPDKTPETKNDAVDQTLNSEVVQRIGKLEESLSAEFNNSIPDEVTQEENSQRPSQSASNPNNGERSDADQLVANSIAFLTKQKSTEQLSQQQPSHVDSEPNREPSANSPIPVRSQKVASIAGATANSSPKYGIEGFPNPAPRYPYLSRANGEEGKVILQVVVDKYGLASEITIVQSSGYRRLDKAATKAVKKWKFQPALNGGFNVQGVVQIPISFVLRNS